MNRFSITATRKASSQFHHSKFHHFLLASWAWVALKSFKKILLVLSVALLFVGCEKDEAVFGCTNPLANNYNPSATNNLAAGCRYSGCTDRDAYNYDPRATEDDRSCAYTPPNYEISSFYIYGYGRHSVTLSVRSVVELQAVVRNDGGSAQTSRDTGLFCFKEGSSSTPTSIYCRTLRLDKNGETEFVYAV